MTDAVETKTLLKGTRRRSWPWRRESGQGMVEFALTFPLMFLLLILIIEFGFVFHAYVSVVFAAKAGARSGAVYYWDWSYDNPAINRLNRESGYVSGTPPITKYNENVRDTMANSLGYLNKGTFNRGDKDNNGNIVITYSQVATNPLHPASGAGDMINVTVTYPYHWLSPVLSSSTLTLTGQASARIEP